MYGKAQEKGHFPFVQNKKRNVGSAKGRGPQALVGRGAARVPSTSQPFLSLIFFGPIFLLMSGAGLQKFPQIAGLQKSRSAA